MKKKGKKEYCIFSLYFRYFFLSLPMCWNIHFTVWERNRPYLKRNRHFSIIIKRFVIFQAGGWVPSKIKVLIGYFQRLFKSVNFLQPGMSQQVCGAGGACWRHAKRKILSDVVLFSRWDFYHRYYYLLSSLLSLLLLRYYYLCYHCCCSCYYGYYY